MIYMDLKMENNSFRVWGDSDEQLKAFALSHHIHDSWMYKATTGAATRPEVVMFDIVQRRVGEMIKSGAKTFPWAEYCGNLGVYPHVGVRTLDYSSESNLKDGATPISIAERFRVLRGTRTIKEMSLKTRVSAITISKLESGQISPNTELIGLYCKALAMTPEEFMVGVDLSNEGNINLRDGAMKALIELDHLAHVKRTIPSSIRAYISYLERKNRELQQGKVQE